jgi:hypothetical protein
MLTERRGNMPRTILMHLNVIVSDGDDRSTPEIVAAVEAAIEVGSDHEDVRELTIETVLSEEL